MSTVNFGNIRKAFHGETPIQQIYSQNQKVWPPPRLFPTRLQQVGGGVANHMDFHVGETWRWSGISGATGCRLFIATNSGKNNIAPKLPCPIDNDGGQYFSVSPAPDGMVLDPIYFGEQPGSAWFISSRVFDVTFNKALPAGYWWYMGIEQLAGANDDIWNGYEPAHIGGEILP